MSRASAPVLLAIAVVATLLAVPAAAQPPPHSRAAGARVAVIAHRGASGVAPENTIAAV